MNNNGDGYWKKKYDSLLEGVLSLERQLRQHAEIHSSLVAEKKQWEADKALQSTIIAQAVNSANLRSQEQGLEIQQLKEEIKRLKGE